MLNKRYCSIGLTEIKHDNQYIMTTEYFCPECRRSEFYEHSFYGTMPSTSCRNQYGDISPLYNYVVSLCDDCVCCGVCNYAFHRGELIRTDCQKCWYGINSPFVCIYCAVDINANVNWNRPHGHCFVCDIACNLDTLQYVDCNICRLSLSNRHGIAPSICPLCLHNVDVCVEGTLSRFCNANQMLSYFSHNFWNCRNSHNAAVIRTDIINNPSQFIFAPKWYGYRIDEDVVDIEACSVLHVKLFMGARDERYRIRCLECQSSELQQCNYSGCGNMDVTKVCQNHFKCITCQKHWGINGQQYDYMYSHKVYNVSRIKEPNHYGQYGGRQYDDRDRQYGGYDRDRRIGRRNQSYYNGDRYGVKNNYRTCTVCGLMYCYNEYDDECGAGNCCKSCYINEEKKMYRIILEYLIRTEIENRFLCNDIMYLIIRYMEKLVILCGNYELCETTIFLKTFNLKLIDKSIYIYGMDDVVIDENIKYNCSYIHGIYWRAFCRACTRILTECNKRRCVFMDTGVTCWNHKKFKCDNCNKLKVLSDERCMICGKCFCYQCLQSQTGSRNAGYSRNAAFPELPHNKCKDCYSFQVSTELLQNVSLPLHTSYIS